jgi:hypothetical protein
LPFKGRKSILVGEKGKMCKINIRGFVPEKNSKQKLTYLLFTNTNAKKKVNN